MLEQKHLWEQEALLKCLLSPSQLDYLAIQNFPMKET